MAVTSVAIVVVRGGPAKRHEDSCRQPWSGVRGPDDQLSRQLHGQFRRVRGGIDWGEVGAIQTGPSG